MATSRGFPASVSASVKISKQTATLASDRPVAVPCAPSRYVCGAKLLTQTLAGVSCRERWYLSRKASKPRRFTRAQRHKHKLHNRCEVCSNGSPLTSCS